MKNDLTPQQKKKLKEFAKFAEGGNLAIVGRVMDMEEKFDTTLGEIKAILPGFGSSVDPEVYRGEPGLAGENGLAGRDGRDGRDGKDGKSIVGPSGRDGVDGELPDINEIVLNVLDQIPTPKDGVDGSPDTPNQVVEKVNTATEKIKSSQVEGLDDVARIAKTNQQFAAMPPTTTFVNGTRAKNLNFIGATVSVTGDTANVTTSSGLKVTEIDGSPSVSNPTAIKFSNGSVTDNGDGTVTVTTGAGGGGDVSSNTSTSVDSEVAIFSGTGGKTIKRATLTATVVKSTSGVLTAATAETDYVTPSGTGTLTNKRITKRVLALSAGSATPAINTDSYDVVHITAQSAAITSFTTNLTGTPVDGDSLSISITDDGTARALSFGASFEAGAAALPTTTVVSTRLDVDFRWNTVTTKWRCMAVSGGTTSSGFQQPTSGTVDGSNAVFVWATAPNVISVDGVPKQKVSSDTTVNWTGTTTTTLSVAPTFDVFAIA